ncbi:hypothetical protein FRX31_011427 [Thalictrum thalictroides]|uniref:Uncharacterized protein n=1 Tax=Thalictrum thalictroides TaxID=46969 RepID=A0A7J6WR90_THATH|nr:hypothetical protein FRX31_011427 [Thalictrum thalictroides]
MQGVKLEDIPRVVYVEERGYRFPVVIVLEEEVELQKEMEMGHRNKEGGIGDPTVQTVSGRVSGMRDNVPMVQEAAKQMGEVQMDNARHGQNTKEEQFSELPDPSHRHRSKPNGSRSVSAQSFNSGYPSLKLSRIIWPNHKTGKKDRFYRIKRIAQQALEKECLKSSKLEKEHQQFDCLSVHSDTDDSVTSPMCDKKERARRGKAIQKGDSVAEQGTAKAWVRKETATVLTKEEVWDGPPGFERKEINPVGVNFAHLIDQECCHLRSEAEVNKWIDSIIVLITKQLNLSSIKGDDAIRIFFKALGVAKLKENRESAIEDDERERLNYANCNEDVRGKKVS